MREKIAIGKICIYSKNDVRIYIKAPYNAQFIDLDKELVLIIVKIPETEEEKEILRQMVKR